MNVARFIAHHSRAIILVAILLAIPAVIGMNNTGVDYDTLNYLPKTLDSMKGMKILNEEFGDAASAFLIVDRKSTQEVMAIKEKVAKIKGVASAVWIDDIVDPRIPKEILPAALRDGFFAGDSTLMIIRFSGPSASASTEAAIKGIRAATDKDCHLAGTSATNLDSKDLSNRETPIYLLLAVLFSALVLGLSMESYLIPFIFLAQIGLAILFNMGSNIFLGKVSSLTQGLAAILQLGVTMDFSIFLLHRYEDERKRHGDNKEAMAEAIHKTFLTIAGGALTEVAGFLALCVMDLKLGADIGVVMAKGVVIGLVCTMSILPSLILFFDGPIHRLRHRPFLPTFKATAAFVSKHCVILSVVLVLAFIPAVYGRQHTKQFYNLVDILPKSLPSIEALSRLKTDFKMTTTHFVIVKDGLPPAAIRKLLSEMEGLDGVTSVLAFEKYLGALIPEEFIPASVRSIFKVNGREMIVVNSVFRSATSEENHQLDSLIKLTKSYDPDSYITGEGALSKDLIDITAFDFIRVDLVSMALVFVIIAIIFTSLFLPVVLVGSIELAICINLAVPFYLGESVPFIASIVIGCIQLGVTIDYAILLVMRFKEELAKGFERHEAMRLALQGSARSIFTGALALFAATEGVSLISQMAILQAICGMIARGALISMGVILFLLPSLLIVSEGLISRTSLFWRHPFVRKRPASKESSL